MRSYVIDFKESNNYSSNKQLNKQLLYKYATAHFEERSL